MLLCFVGLSQLWGSAFLDFFPRWGKGSQGPWLLLESDLGLIPTSTTFCNLEQVTRHLTEPQSPTCRIRIRIAWDDVTNHLAPHTGCPWYISAMLTMLVSARGKIDGFRAEGIGVQSPGSYMSLEGERGLLCSPRLLTYVYDLPRHPFLCLLALVGGPMSMPAWWVLRISWLPDWLRVSVRTGLISSPPRASKRHACSHFIFFRALGPSRWLVLCPGSFLELCRHHWLPHELDREPMLPYRHCLLPYK